MRKFFALFLLGFFIFQFASLEVPRRGSPLLTGFARAEARTGPSDKAGYRAEARTGPSAQKGRTWQSFMPRCVTECYAENEKVDPNEWDFGRVKQGAVLKHDFTFKNDTPGILKITGINTSCGCTVSQAEKKSLPPGESTVINVTFNSQGYSGAVKQFIYVNTDNVGLPVIRFVVKAEVIK